MADFSINVTRGTGTDYVGFDNIDATGTATTVGVQWVKLLDGTGTDRLTINSAGAALVQHVGTATIPVSLTSLPTTATLAVAVQNTATVTLTGLPSTATIPVSVQNTATVTLTGLPSTATIPVSVQNTATVTLTGLPSTATIPVSVGNTATVQVSAIVPGTGASNLGKAEDAAHSSGDTGIFILGVRNDAGSALSGADLDYTPIRVNSAGNVITQGRGFVAHNATADTNPMLIGAYAETQEDSEVSDQVSDGDLTHVKASRDGAIYTLPHPPRIWRAFYDGTAATTDGTVKAAATATGLRHFIGTIFAGVNAGATVALHVGTGTASQIWKHFFATAGDGAVMQFNPPIPMTATQPLMVTTAATTFALSITGYTAP